MKELFSPNSRLMQVLNKIADFVFINLIYIFCCVPIVTIGAAQAGLFSATRVQMSEEKSESGYKAFFTGFKSGFGKITVVWVGLTLVIAMMAFVSYAALYAENSVGSTAGIMATVALGLLVVLQLAASAFHSRFECGGWELVKNAVLMLLMYPVQMLCTSLFIWLPALVAFVNLELFVRITPILLFLYYSMAFQLATRLLKKPFNAIENQFFPKPEVNEEQVDFQENA